MDDKKKLLLIVPTLHQGGQERVVVRSAKILADKFEVTVAIFDDSEIGYDVEGLNIVNLKVPSSELKIFKLINILRRRAKLKSLKKKLQPDIAYSHGGTANIVNCLTTGFGATWVSIHSYLDVTYTWYNRLYRLKADKIICCSKEIAGVIGGNAVTLYNLYDCDEIIAESEKGEPDEPLPEKDEYGIKMRYLMCMGRDDDHKMFWHMIKTFKLIQLSIPEARLLILGSGTYDIYRRMTRRLGIEDYVIFAGMQDNPFKYLKHGEIIWSTSRIEGFPNVLVEGMALGLVPVATNCSSGPAEILLKDGNTQECNEIFEQMEQDKAIDAIYGDYGILTPPMTYEKDLDYAHITEEHFNLASVILSLLRDQDKLDSYHEKARERAREFGYEPYLKNFLALCEEQGIDK